MYYGNESWEKIQNIILNIFKYLKTFKWFIIGFYYFIINSFIYYIIYFILKNNNKIIKNKKWESNNVFFSIIYIENCQ